MLFKTIYHHRLVLYVFILCGINSVVSRSSQPGLSVLKSKISGVDELLEEFRKQLQQDQAYSWEDDAGDVCLSDFTEMEEHINTNSGMSNQMSSRRRPLDNQADNETSEQDMDEPLRIDAGQDVVVQLPTDWAVLDGRDSVDDHGVARYDWALVKGNPSLAMKVTHPGLLKITDLQMGEYVFQLTTTDTAGQRSSENVTVTVLAPEHHAEGAILPLVLGILISALLLLMVGCRLRLVRHKLKKARPLTTEESDYLINGMYL